MSPGKLPMETVFDGIVSMLITPTEPKDRRQFYIKQIYISFVIIAVCFSAYVFAPIIESIIYPKDLIAEYYILSIVGILTGIIGGSYAILQIFLEFGSDKPIAEAWNAPAISVDPATRSAGTSEAQTDGVISETIVRRPPLPRHEAFANSIRSRLRSEIRDQGRKANTNLAFGVITAFLGLGFLGWLAWDTSRAALPIATATATFPPQTSPLSPMFYWGQFAAKVTLAISANAFSLFFLSTYRRNLTEIKYFQNELTNIDLKLIALFLSGHKSYTETEKKLLISLSTAERNFILRKGETTADIQLKNLDASETAALMAMFANAAENFGKSTAAATRSSARAKPTPKAS